MPRKNQRRKNVNSQSGVQRKAKPIKFNPSELEEEQKRQLDIESIENDAIDVQSEPEITTVNKIIWEHGNTSDNATVTDDSTGKCDTMEQNDIVQEGAVIENPVMSIPPSNQPNEHPATTTNSTFKTVRTNKNQMETLFLFEWNILFQFFLLLSQTFTVVVVFFFALSFSLKFD